MSNSQTKKINVAGEEFLFSIYEGFNIKWVNRKREACHFNNKMNINQIQHWFLKCSVVLSTLPISSAFIIYTYICTYIVKASHTGYSFWEDTRESIPFFVCSNLATKVNWDVFIQMCRPLACSSTLITRNRRRPLIFWGSARETNPCKHRMQHRLLQVHTFVLVSVCCLQRQSAA